MFRRLTDTLPWQEQRRVKLSMFGRCRGAAPPLTRATYHARSSTCDTSLTSEGHPRFRCVRPAISSRESLNSFSFTCKKRLRRAFPRRLVLETLNLPKHDIYGRCAPPHSPSEAQAFLTFLHSAKALKPALSLDQPGLIMKQLALITRATRHRPEPPRSTPLAPPLSLETQTHACSVHAPQASFEELLDLNRAAGVKVQQLEEAPGIPYV